MVFPDHLGKSNIKKDPFRQKQAIDQSHSTKSRDISFDKRIGKITASCRPENQPFVISRSFERNQDIGTIQATSMEGNFNFVTVPVLRIIRAIIPD
jgi:hypothetical protein